MRHRKARKFGAGSRRQLRGGFEPIRADDDDDASDCGISDVGSLYEGSCAAGCFEDERRRPFTATRREKRCDPVTKAILASLDDDAGDRASNE